MLYVTWFEPEASASGNCCVYRYGIVCCTYISISSLVAGRVLILMEVQHTCAFNRLPEDEPWGSKQVEDIKN
jgi:hypothetical protein